MSRKLASIVEIESVCDIEDSDRLSVARMKGKGWNVVVGRGEFKPGDICVFFEIDSALDPDDERYAFLKERCLRKFVSNGGNVLREVIRIKTVKLRGVVSQGLLMPISLFPEIEGNVVIRDGKTMVRIGGIEEELVGADVTSVLRVEHFDEIAASYVASSGDIAGPFPQMIPKTDEERIHNLKEWFSTMKGRRWQVSQKCDGMSCTIAYAPSIDQENPVIVCSRNYRIKPMDNNGITPIGWKMNYKYGISNKLKKLYEERGKEIALQGELVGPGINKCRNKEKEHKFLVFRAWDIQKQEFVDPDKLEVFCHDNFILHVPVIAAGFSFFDEIVNMEEALKYAEGKTPEGNEREGVVCKTDDGGPYASFKIVSNKYLLKSGD